MADELNYKQLFIKAIIFALIILAIKLAIKLALGWTPAAHGAEVKKYNSVQELIGKKPSSTKYQIARVDTTYRDTLWLDDFNYKMALDNQALDCATQAAETQAKWGNGQKALEKCEAMYGAKAITYYNSLMNSKTDLPIVIMWPSILPSMYYKY